MSQPLLLITHEMWLTLPTSSFSRSFSAIHPYFSVSRWILFLSHWCFLFPVSLSPCLSRTLSFSLSPALPLSLSLSLSPPPLSLPLSLQSASSCVTQIILFLSHASVVFSFFPFLPPICMQHVLTPETQDSQTHHSGFKSRWTVA